MLYEVLLVSYLLIALALIGFVLIQQGKGADMGASFGSGGANTVFGSAGSGNFMTRTTAILATGFFLISLILGNLSAGKETQTDSWENLDVPAAATVTPEVPVPANNDVPVANKEDKSDSDVPNG